MKFNIYGRFQLDIRREYNSWKVYRLEMGRRTRMTDFVIPDSLEADEIATYLDDILHELSGPGQCIELLP